MRLARGIPRLTRPALALLAAVSLLASLLLGGHRYFYCPAMHEMGLRPCCARGGDAPDDAAGASATIDDAECCTADRLAAPAPAAGAPAPPAPRAPLVALVPPVSPVVAPPALPAELRVRAARAGPGDPRPHAHRLRTMVSLT